MVDDEGEQEKIEKHVKGIKPKVFPKFALFGPPRSEGFHKKKEERNANQPVEVVSPAGLADFIDEITPVTSIGILDDL
jgi:hypothetical protein